jgi:hypothetical protein
MEFRIVAKPGPAAMTGKSTYSAQKALEILRTNSDVEAEEATTGKRFSLAQLEKIVAETAGDA